MVRQAHHERNARFAQSLTPTVRPEPVEGQIASVTRLVQNPSPHHLCEGRAEAYKNSGAKTNATIDISLIRMFSAGPDVSLKGSPTVSPTTTAAC